MILRNFELLDNSNHTEKYKKNEDILGHDFETNLVTIINVERDYHTGTVVNIKYWPPGPVSPFIDPNMMPGQVN